MVYNDYTSEMRTLRTHVSYKRTIISCYNFPESYFSWMLKDENLTLPSERFCSPPPSKIYVPWWDTKMYAMYFSLDTPFLIGLPYITTWLYDTTCMIKQYWQQ